MKYYILLLIGLVFLGCNSPKSFTGETTYKGSSEKGTVLLSTAGYGQSKALALENAEINAFKVLLFKGVPGSQYNIPMIKDEAKARQQYQSFFEQFFDGQGYKTFLMISKPTSKYDPLTNRSKNLKADIKINVQSLRKTLEKEGVIRKFGL